jgi:hypothetical protein
MRIVTLCEKRSASAQGVQSRSCWSRVARSVLPPATDGKALARWIGKEAAVSGIACAARANIDRGTVKTLNTFPQQSDAAPHTDSTTILDVLALKFLQKNSQNFSDQD